MPALRLGVLVTGAADVEIWRRLLEDIAADPRFDLNIVVDARVRSARRSSWLYRLVSHWDRKLLARFPAPSTNQCDTLGRLARVTICTDSSGLIDSDRADLESLALDLIVKLSGGPIDPDLACIPRLGLWTFDFLQDEPAWADAFTLRDIVNGAPVNRVALIRADAARETIGAASFNIKFSAARAAAFARDKSGALLLRELRRVADTGVAANDPIPPREPAPAPSIWMTLLYCAALAIGLARLTLSMIGERIGVRPGMFTLYWADGDFESASFANACEIAPRAGEFWADPFVFDKDGARYIFFENYSYRSGLGRISVGAIKDGAFAYIGDALVSERHLSYPFVFAHNGEIFMMPETHQTQRLEIWRCVDFPLKWTLHATALEGAGPVDSTLFEHDGGWWLFTNLSSGAIGDHCGELHVFQVDGPDLRTITPHRHNPVHLDSRAARNAGRIAVRRGRLLRMAQDNSHGRYGYGLKIMEIVSLDLDRFEERLVRHIEPNFRPGLIGCHHLDFTSDGFVFDARKRIGGPGWFRPRQ